MNKALPLLLILGAGGCSGPPLTLNLPPTPSPESHPSPVPRPPLGVATLSWDAPTLTTDGTPLDNLGALGYIISYGTDPAALTNTITTDLQLYTIQPLGSGTWYFTIQTTLPLGGISAPSQVVSKVVE